jgi:hypothetical protein
MTGAVPRRELLRAGAAGGLGIAVGGSLEAIAGPVAARAAVRPATGYGELVRDPAGLLALPKGFRYAVVARSGVTRLTTGQPTPSDPDGTACFRARDGWALVNNHEIGGAEQYHTPPLAGLTYDPGAGGGTTTIDVDRHGKRVREYVSLAGTHNNCAGGVTPWKTWLTCEESEVKAGGAFQKDHGYVFEVDPLEQSANHHPVPLKFLGRYAHEAVAVDPHTHRIYLTEDAASPLGLYYRWTPPHRFRGGKGALRALALGHTGATAGRLQAMCCTTSHGKHVTDLSEATRPGTRYHVKWEDVPERDGRIVPVRKQLNRHQITRSRKLEGQWWGDGGVYFVASYARNEDGSRNEHDGQVWFYDPDEHTVTLRTLFGINHDRNNDHRFDGPDNITLSPYGGLMMAEDGNGSSHIVGLTEHGVAFPMARSQLEDTEFTGPTFSPDGDVLFVNIQYPGHVLAITGPWGHRKS